MNTNFLNDFKVAIVALLAVLNSTNSPVQPSEPVAVLGMTFTNLVSTNSIELLVYTNVSVPSPLDGPSTEMWPAPVTNRFPMSWLTKASKTNLQIPFGMVYQSALPTNTFVLTSRTNWITDDEIKVLVTSGQVCRVRGHVWQDGCGMLGCLVMHYGPRRHCPLCGKVETQQIGEWK